MSEIDVFSQSKKEQISSINHRLSRFVCVLCFKSVCAMKDNTIHRMNNLIAFYDKLNGKKPELTGSSCPLATICQSPNLGQLLSLLVGGIHCSRAQGTDRGKDRLSTGTRSVPSGEI